MSTTTVNHQKILIVFGTRPEAIKMAPVVRALQGEPTMDVKVCVTAQHREMLDQVLGLFEIAPDYDLDLMRPGQELTEITTSVLTGLRPILRDWQPQLVLVHGDTTTTFAASLAAYYEHIPVGHVEAGLSVPANTQRRRVEITPDRQLPETQAERIRRIKRRNTDVAG